MLCMSTFPLFLGCEIEANTGPVPLSFFVEESSSRHVLQRYSVLSKIVVSSSDSRPGFFPATTFTQFCVYMGSGQNTRVQGVMQVSHHGTLFEDVGNDNSTQGHRTTRPATARHACQPVAPTPLRVDRFGCRMPTGPGGHENFAA
jgi:hypothetical protein